MIHLKTGLYTETRYICIKKDMYFIPNKEYTFLKDEEEKYFREKDTLVLYSEDYIKNIFVLDKKYYRELNLKALLDE